MSAGQFITDIVIVSGKDKCPPGFFMVSLTVGRNDADLYEGSLVKRGERYLCFAKFPDSGTVVTDLNIVKDRDSIPTGFTGIKTCRNDGGEKSLRKHVFCVKTDNIQKAQHCVVNVVAVQQSKGESAPGNCYTILNDVNGINICYETMPNTQMMQPPAYGHQANMPYRPPMVQPSYPSSHNMPYPAPSQHVPYQSMPVPSMHQGTAAPPQLTRQISPTKLSSGIQGVQFQVNPKFELLWKQSALSEKSARTCSLDDIEKKYGYNFETERNLLALR